MQILRIIESITGLTGFGILWWQTNGWIALAVFLLLTSLYQKMEINLFRTLQELKNKQ